MDNTACALAHQILIVKIYTWNTDSKLRKANQLRAYFHQVTLSSSNSPREIFSHLENTSGTSDHQCMNSIILWTISLRCIRSSIMVIKIQSYRLVTHSKLKVQRGVNTGKINHYRDHRWSSPTHWLPCTTVDARTANHLRPSGCSSLECLHKTNYSINLKCPRLKGTIKCLVSRLKEHKLRKITCKHRTRERNNKTNLQRHTHPKPNHWWTQAHPQPCTTLISRKECPIPK